MIFVGKDVRVYIQNSKNIYVLHDASGVVIKKSGHITFDFPVEAKAVELVISKIGGDGKFFIDGDECVASLVRNNFLIDTSAAKQITISRPVQCTGDIIVSSLRIIQSNKQETIIMANSASIRSNLSKCREVKGFTFVVGHVLAQPNASIELGKDAGLKTLITAPENCYKFVDDKIIFPIKCKIIEFEITGGAESRQNMIEEVIDADLSKSPEIDVSSKPRQEEVAVASPAIIDTTIHTVFYSSQDNKFSSAVKRRGHFVNLRPGHVNNELLLYPNTEIKIPYVADAGTNAVEIIIGTKQNQRKGCPITVGVVDSSGVFNSEVTSIEEAEFRIYVPTTVGNNEAIISIPANFKDGLRLNKLIIRRSSMQKVVEARAIATAKILNLPVKTAKSNQETLDTSVNMLSSLGKKRKVSIVMSLKNRTNFLKYTLETLIKQTMPKDDFELVVVDDGSSEDLEGFLLKYSKRLNIKYIKINYHKSDIPIWSHTPALSNNVGFKNADGEVIIICGPEILHKETNLEVAYRAAMRDISAFGLVWHSNMHFVNNVFAMPDPEKISFDNYMKMSGSQHECITKNAFYWYLLAVKKEHVMRIGGVDEEYGRGVCGEDDNFAARLNVAKVPNTHAFDIVAIHMEHNMGDDKYDKKRHRNTREWKEARQINLVRWNEWHHHKKAVANENREWGSNNVIDVIKSIRDGLVFDHKNYDVTTTYKLNNLKVLYLPLAKQTGTEEAFKKFGVDLKIFDFLGAAGGSGSRKKQANEELVRVATEFKPDLIHMQLQYTNIISPSTLQKIKSLMPNVIMSNWSGDVRAEVPSYFNEVGKVIDYTLMCNTGQLPKLSKVCKNALYWQNGVSTAVCHPKFNTELKYDVCFVANCYSQFPGYKERMAFGKALKTEYKGKCAIFGGGWPANISNGFIEWDQVNDLYNQSKVVISISNFNNIADYFSDRFLMSMASGRPVLSWTFPNIENYITEGVNGYVMKSVDEGMSKLKRMLSEPKILDQVGACGAKTVLENHTFVSRIKELLTIVNLLK